MQIHLNLATFNALSKQELINPAQINDLLSLVSYIKEFVNYLIFPLI